MSASVGGKINIPRSPIVDTSTGMLTLPWLLWLQNPSVNSLSSATAFPATSGGTGVTSSPQNGQILIGNGASYTLSTLTAGAGIGIANAAGNITIQNTGVSSIVGGNGITVTNTGGAATVSLNSVLGSLASQNSNSVGITGGSLSNVSISNSTASVTTLKTSSTITINNLANTGTHSTIAKWLPVICDGTTYYLPLYN